MLRSELLPVITAFLEGGSPIPLEWTPVVTDVEDLGTDWRVFYNSREYVETGAVSWALAGNLPLLVDKTSLSVRVDDAWTSH